MKKSSSVVNAKNIRKAVKDMVKGPIKVIDDCNRDDSKVIKDIERMFGGMFKAKVVTITDDKTLPNGKYFELSIVNVPKEKRILKNKSIGYNKKAKLPLSSAMKEHIRNKAVGIGKETITGTPKEIIKKPKSKNK